MNSQTTTKIAIATAFFISLAITYTIIPSKRVFKIVCPDQSYEVVAVYVENTPKAIKLNAFGGFAVATFPSDCRVMPR